VSSTALTEPGVALRPPAPRTLEESGLSAALVTQLLLKHLHFGADLTGHELASRTGLEFSVIQTLLESLCYAHLCEVVGGSIVGGPSFRYRISDEGRRKTLLYLEHSHYVGPAPVPVAQYRAYMLAHGRADAASISRARVREAFSHLVLSDRVLDQVGPAVAAGHSMFVYGPPGNGKTVIAQAIEKLIDGEIAVPHAIEVEGQIIRVFDPVSHRALSRDPEQGGLVRRPAADGRWVACRRPMVMVGGELTLEALDLSYSRQLGFYGAPVQTKANGGVLVIDDFGRQRSSPRELLNRWIVPLESGVDFLTLETGQKFDVPFQVLVVFATNITPADLVDEAFLRRIHYKVFAESPTRAEFDAIFEQCCRARGLAYDRSLVDALITRSLEPRGVRFRGCHPRDLIDHALASARYLGQPRQLTPDLLEAACAGYFVDDPERPAAAASA
jgi:hypothetical protein